MAKTLLLDVEFLSYTLGGWSQDNLVVGMVVLLFVWLDLNVLKCEYVVGVCDLYMIVCGSVIVCFKMPSLLSKDIWLLQEWGGVITSRDFYKNGMWLLITI